MRLAILGLALLLGGCVNTLQERQSFLTQLVGKPEIDAITSLGVPNRSFETDGVKFLAWDQQRIDVVGGGGGPWGWGWGWGGGFPAQVVVWSCETTLAVRGGVIVSYNLRGNAC